MNFLFGFGNAWRHFRPRRRSWLAASAWAACTTLLLAGPCLAAPPLAPAADSETRYLLFQMFTAGAEPGQALGATVALREMPDRATIRTFARGLKERIGNVGDRRRKLGLMLGPLALDHSDAQVRQLIRDAFAEARSLDMALALHLDDAMFWTRHAGLQAAGSAHLEWTDWAATKNTGRRIDWGPSPAKLAPQLCFNSAPVVKAVQERGALIGSEVAREVQALKAEGREHLFAGIVAGWETMLGRDFDSDRATGFCALTNNGYSRSKPPPDMQAARDKVVSDFMALWATSLRNAGVPEHRIYNHIAFTAQGLNGNVSDHPGGDSAFGGPWRPGFSTYPAPGALAETLALLQRHGSPPWASVEGTNVVPNGMPGERTMETYLGRMFNRGAMLVNIFAWGVGPDDARRNPFRVPTEGPDAIAGYRTFLEGKVLREVPAEPFSLQSFQRKLQTLQQQLPQWVQRTRRQADAEAAMRRIDGHAKRGDLPAADAAVDDALGLVQAK